MSMMRMSMMRKRGCDGVVYWARLVRWCSRRRMCETIALDNF